MGALKNIARKYMETSLILRIVIGLVIGAVLECHFVIEVFSCHSELPVCRPIIV